MRRAWVYGFVASLALALPAAGAATRSEIYGWLEALGSTLEIIGKQALDPPDPVVLVNGAMDGMVRAVDADSEYIDPDAFQAMQDPLGAATAGLHLQEDDGLLLIVAVGIGGPAEAAGVRPGDYLTAVDGRSVVGARFRPVMAQLRGEAGRTVRLRVLSTDGARREVALVLAKPAEAVVRSRKIGAYGYVRSESLSEQATREVETAVAALRREDIAGLVLDLRGNPGGLLDQSYALADLFLERGPLGHQIGRKGDKDTFAAKPGDALNGLPMVVLVDGGTAAGAELIAAALQDNRRARIVGMPTYGRGSVQSVIMLPKGDYGAVKVTSSRLHRASGAPLGPDGVTPDRMVARSAADAARPPRKGRAVPAVAATAPPAGQDAKGDFQLDQALALLAQPERTKKPGR